MTFQRSIIGFSLFFLTACGGSSGSGIGNLSVKVIDSRRPAGLSAEAPLPPEMVVDYFTIRISGENIEPAIEQTIPGEARKVEIDGIPVGHDRVFLIEARNVAGQVIRRRRISHVAIEPGVISPLEAKLNTVPIFSNLSDGNVITISRLYLRGYAEPGAGLEIIDDYQGTTLPLADLDNTTIVTPSRSLGDFSFKPGILRPGSHLLTVKDLETGESSSVHVTLVAADSRPGRVIASGGVRPRSGLGLSIFHSTGRGGNFPLILKKRRENRQEISKGEKL